MKEERGLVAPGEIATEISTELATLSDEARRFAELGIAENSKRAYKNDWKHFVDWCEDHHMQALPATPQQVTLYLTDLASTFATATIQRRMVSINKAHRLAGHPQPCKDELVQTVWKGIRRKKGSRRKKARPLLVEHVVEICGVLTEKLIDVRDRAILLLGFSAALRRSEIAAIEVGDIEWSEQGIILHVRFSKTDQEGEGRTIGVPYGRNPETCPVLAVESWIRRAYLEDGPLFRSVDRHRNVSSWGIGDRTIAQVVKKLVARIDLDPEGFSGHSLRSGLATSAAIAGVPERLIMKQTGHKSVMMVRQYIHDGSIFRENPVSKLDL